MFLKYLPPSPVLDLSPTRFMAFARAVWASMEMEPKLMASGSIICSIISVTLKIRQLQSHLLQISWQSRKQVGPHQCWRTHQKWRVQAGHVACNDVKFPSSILANGQKNRDYYPWPLPMCQSKNERSFQRFKVSAFRNTWRLPILFGSLTCFSPPWRQ